MKIYLAFILILFSLNFVLADTIEDTTVHVKIYNTTLELTNPDYSGNNKNVTLIIVNDSIVLRDEDFTILFVRNETVGKSTVDELIDCIAAKGACDVEKSQFNMGWNICKSDLATCQSNNNESVKQKLNDCELDKQRIQIDLDAQTKKVTDLEKEQKSSGNSKFVWGIGGGILAFLATMFLTGKWGVQGKDKSQEEMNPNRGY